LGMPPPFGIMFFTTGFVIELTKDRCWLLNVTTAINQQWHKKNATKTSRSAADSRNGHSPLPDLPATASH